MHNCQVGLVEYAHKDDSDEEEVSSGPDETPAINSSSNGKTVITIGIAWKNAKGSLERRVIYSQNATILNVILETQQGIIEA